MVRQLHRAKIEVGEAGCQSRLNKAAKLYGTRGCKIERIQIESGLARAEPLCFGLDLNENYTRTEPVTGNV